LKRLEGARADLEQLVLGKTLYAYNTIRLQASCTAEEHVDDCPHDITVSSLKASHTWEFDHHNPASKTVKAGIWTVVIGTHSPALMIAEIAKGSWKYGGCHGIKSAAERTSFYINRR
jgi:hypothetical protein